MLSYMYGGAGFGANSSGYDDLYILSLPSFTWIKWWENPSSSARPHNMLSCNVVNKAQMLIVGGSFPKDQSNCDSSPSWGTHNVDLNEPAPGQASFNPWNTYQPNLTSYAVPSAIISVIGGSYVLIAQSLRQNADNDIVLQAAQLCKLLLLGFKTAI